MATGLTPVTRKEMYLSAAAGETSTSDLPTPVTREEIYLNEIAQGGGGSGGTSDYSDLTNKPQINDITLSGNKTGSELGLQNEVLGSWTAGESTTHVTPASTDTVLQALQKIDNNQRNDETNILSEQAKTTGMTEGGSNYITVGGIRVYVSATAPTGDIPDGSVGVGW